MAMGAGRLHPVHERYIKRAFELAALGWGRTSPNPPVGAVVVKQGRIVAEAFHTAAGRPHAEAVALRRAGPLVRGADVYVTLEPCWHFGRTPGCAQTLAQARVGRVFYAVEDPDRRVSGRGRCALEAAGVEVVAGVLGAYGRRFYEPYFKFKRFGRPYFVCKIAATLDGRVAARTGKARWITGEAARERVHRMRDWADAVVVGVGTVLADDPLLTCRLSGAPGKDPARVVVDTWARTPPGAKVIRASAEAPCIVAVGEAADEERVRELERAGAEVWRLPMADGRVDLRALAAEMGRRGFITALVEAGPRLQAAMLRAGLVDKLVIFYGAKVLADPEAVPMFMGGAMPELSSAWRWNVVNVEVVGGDVMVECEPMGGGLGEAG